MKNLIKHTILYSLAKLKPSIDGPKVFCIGYNKTGTTSLGKSLKLLGYNHSSFNMIVWRKYKKGSFSAVFNYTNKFNSFDDLPWLLTDLIPLLDDRYHNSKFVYLERKEEDWKKSIVNWTHKVTGNEIDPSVAWQKYTMHKEWILNYFKDNPNFIILNIDDPLGFAKLAAFLDKSAPQKHFPHYNKT